MNKTTAIIIITIITAIGLTGSAAAAQEKKHQMPPTVVKTMRTQQKTWQESIAATGSLSAFNGVMLSSEAAGRITKIYFHSGVYVQQGDPLIQIFPDIAKAELEKAKAQLTESKLDYQRNLKLFKKGFITKAMLDKFRAVLDGDQADVDDYQAKLDQLLIRAPFSGNIGLRKVSVGDYVNPGNNLVSLQSVDPIRVDFSVPQKYLGSIKIGDMVTITSRAFTKDYSGQIYALDSAVNQNTRAIDVRAKFPNSDHILIPGTFVVVKINIQHPQPVIVIPATAIVYSEGSNYVYLAVNHKAVKTNVTVGKMLKDNRVIVTKGLKAGDNVIIEGQMKLFDGYPVVTEQEYQQMAAGKQ